MSYLACVYVVKGLGVNPAAGGEAARWRLLHTLTKRSLPVVEAEADTLKASSYSEAEARHVGNPRTAEPSIFVQYPLPTRASSRWLSGNTGMDTNL